MPAPAGKGEQKESFFAAHRPFFRVPFLFTVDAATVWLAVNLSLPGNPHPFFPAKAKITIKKRNGIFLGKLFPDTADQFVFLILAV
jgi:hypothetical protein